MREFDTVIGRVWRRLRFQRFLGALVWCLAGVLLVTAVVIAVETFEPSVVVPGPLWAPFAIAGAVGLVVAALIALFTGPSRVDAAVAIDHAFHLNERLSTALTLPEHLRETAAGRALLADARRHVGDLDIGAKFGLRVPRRAWVPLVPAALAVGLLFVPDWVQQRNQVVAREAEKLDEEVVARQAETLKKGIAETRKKLEEVSDAETAKLLAEIEKMADEMAKSPPAEKQKAMVQLNKLTDALKERRDQFGSTEQIQKQLQQLKEMSGGGPAEEFARELARGDFQQAAEKLKDLQQKLAKNQLSEAEKKQLMQQLGQMKEQLQQVANLQERRKMLEEARKNGGLSQQEYERQMAKLDAQAQQLQQLQKLSEKLGAAQMAMQQGDMAKAAAQLGMSQQQLQQMADSLQSLETLDSAMAEMMDAKAGMSGDQLNQFGEGMDGMNQFGLGDMDMRGNGNGLGRGRGRGDRPEAPDNVAYTGSKVPQQYGKGKAVIEGFAPPQGATPGESVIDIQGELQATGAATAEALSNQRIPNSVKKHVLGYFEQVREDR